MFQSPLNIKHKSGHLFTLDPQLFLEEVDADGFLVALGERAPTISGQSKFQTKEKNIEDLWIMLDFPTAPLPTISTCGKFK